MLPNPKNWLGNLNPGINNLPTGGFTYVTGKLVPFVISMLLFLIIVGSLVFVVVGGIMWITSQGEKEGLAKAKATITYALLGLALGIGSFTIMRILGYLLNANLLGK